MPLKVSIVGKHFFMRLKIVTPVQQDPEQVMKGFNQDLFTALAPPFPPVKLLRFDGSETGHVVSLELNFIFFKQVWTSHIIDHGSNAELTYFIDKGVKLPFFLRSWRHEHKIAKAPQGSHIIDQITYTTGTLITDWLMYPAMWVQFAYRKPIYKKQFKKA